MASFNIETFGDASQEERRARMVKLLKETPIPDDEILMNLGLFAIPQTLSRILFLDFLYRKILDIQGVIFDFGCRWGQNSSVFSALRGIYEPFNRLRKIVAFDTFAGFPGLASQDGQGKMMTKGGYAVPSGYADMLRQIIAIQEAESPMAHIRKSEIVQGNAVEEARKYLERNPETIIAFAYFDFDLYEPTRECLQAIRDRLTRGSVLGFDELNDHATPGETLAVKEVFGLDRYSIRRFPYNSRVSYLVVE